MKLLSINVGKPREIEYKGRTTRTGIYKEPIASDTRIMLNELNLAGDGQADLMAHGGMYKAVYVYSIENYAYWQSELNRDDFTHGQFGENFTVEDMTEDIIHVGDVFRIGGAIVEVTQPRVPCFKLGVRMNMPTFPKLFLNSNRSGFYLRVLEVGEVGAGDEFELVKADPNQMSVREINNLLYHQVDKVEDAKRALKIEALSPGWRGSFEEIVAQADRV